jgi:cell division protein FtsZ
LQANSTEGFSGGAAEGNKALATEEKIEAGSDLEYLDIPAFLRKQAD